MKIQCAVIFAVKGGNAKTAINRYEKNCHIWDRMIAYMCAFKRR